MLKNLRIRTRLALAFGLLLVFLLTNGITSYVVIDQLQGEVTDLSGNQMPKVEKANIVIDNINIIARALRNLFIDAAPGSQQNELARIDTARELIGTTLTSLKNSADSPEEVEKIETLLNSRTAYINVYKQYIEFIKNGELDQAKKILLGELRRTQAAYLQDCESLIEFQTKSANDIARNAESTAGFAIKVILGMMIVALLFSIVAALLIIRSITTPVEKTVKLAETLAKGDLTAKLEVDHRDEIGDMARAMNTTVDQLRKLIGQIVNGVNRLTESSADLAAVSRQLSATAKGTAQKSATVAAAAEEMSSNIQSVSAAMEQSAGNVSMVASTTEEMTMTVNEIGQNAAKARSVTESAVQQSQATLEKVAILGESANKVGRVTETITEISEQTNLLALNATIEAARAGEAGKGFAVVANEIKELAKQTAAATIEIKNQIDEIQGTTNSTINDIRKNSEVIADIDRAINGIASAVEEQAVANNEIAGNITQASQGIAEVNENVAQSTVVIADITRSIADINQDAGQVHNGSNQVETSARSLSTLAAELDQMMKMFKV